MVSHKEVFNIQMGKHKTNNTVCADSGRDKRSLIRHLRARTVINCFPHKHSVYGIIIPPVSEKHSVMLIGHMVLSLSFTMHGCG